MNIEYLKNFITIVEEKNISSASKKLFIAQPSLSNQIKYLEYIYHSKLMLRGGKNIKLTPQGEELYKRSKEIIEIYNKSFININNLNNGKKDHINIGLPPSIYSLLIDKLLSSFFEKFPSVKVNIFECNALLAQEYLLEGKIDVAIINANVNNIEQFNYRVLEKEYFKAYLPSNSKLLKKEEIEIKDLKNYGIVIPRGYENNLIAHCNNYDFSPLIEVTTITSIAALEIAKKRNLIAIVPLPDKENIEFEENLRPLILDNMNEYSRKVIWQKQKDNSYLVKEFLKCLE